MDGSYKRKMSSSKLSKDDTFAYHLYLMLLYMNLISIN